MQHDNPFTDRDLEKVFEFLTSSDGLFLVKVKGRNPGKVHSNINKMVRERTDVNNGAYPIARLVASDTETLLFQSRFVKKFVKFIEQRSRRGDLVLHEFAVTEADAATALDFYRHATFQARDFIYLIYLSLDLVDTEDLGSTQLQ
jgi:hypothetical protein